MFTLSSVHWADSIVATRSSRGFEWFSAIFASGNSFSSKSMIFRTLTLSSEVFFKLSYSLLVCWLRGFLCVKGLHKAFTLLGAFGLGVMLVEC